MNNKKCILLGVLAGSLFFATEGHALTVVNPPSSWGSDGVIALVGKFVGKTQVPLVVYKNRVNGSCSVVQLPKGAGTDPPLADHVRVNGAGGADIISVSRGGSVTCGNVTWPLSFDEIDRGGFYLQADGLGGDDYIVTWYGLPNHIFGGDGTDSLMSTNERASLHGGTGADGLRAWNSMFLGGDRYLDGQSGNDCLESNNGSSGGPKAQMYCGPDSDERSTFGDASAQVHHNCENPTGNHCVCLMVGIECSTNSECCSSTCSGGFCTSFF